MSRIKHREGICALTNKHVKFVKCHIIPQAVTQAEIKGAPLYQTTRGRGERRRWTSWYDQNLVGREGEDCLSKIDDAAIKILRKHQLVWSSWLVFRPHFESMAPMLPNHGFRKIKLGDPSLLVRFALSIAWRASASSIPDMSEAKLTRDEEDELKAFVLGKQVIGTSPFPVSLTQISSVGIKHNQSPSIERKRIPGFDGSEDRFVKIMRIYMDGLVVHVHFSKLPEEHVLDNPLFIGSTTDTLVSSVNFATSYQYENMLHLMRECHPSLIERSNKIYPNNEV